MCVAEDGVIKRNLARKFKIKTVFNQDDPRCMEEVVTRRIKHSMENPKGAFGVLPNVIFADGGITQIRAVKKAAAKYELDIPVFGMVKDDKHRTKSLIDEKGEDILAGAGLDQPVKEGRHTNILNFITNLQDEVHRIAIGYNKKLRESNMTKSKLDEVQGIGEKKREELLKRFGSIEGIKKADISEIASIKGINEELARKIKEKLDEN